MQANQKNIKGFCTRR